LFTALVIVVSINQLVLQRKFGPLSHQRERLETILSHRHDVEENAGVVSSPTNPTGFLRTTIDATQEHLRQLDETAAESDDEELRRQLTDFADEVLTEI
jgi:hypothetical protein